MSFIKPALPNFLWMLSLLFFQNVTNLSAMEPEERTSEEWLNSMVGRNSGEGENKLGSLESGPEFWHSRKKSSGDRRLIPVKKIKIARRDAKRKLLEYNEEGS